MKKAIILFTTVLLLGAAGIAFAQSTAFTYQGRLNDGGLPANGLYQFKSTLYDAPTNGTSQNGTYATGLVPVTNGLFTLVLDFTDVFPGADRWLELQVRTNGPGAFSTLLPRQRITSTPYAVRALSANTADNATSVAAANITGTLDVAQLSPDVARRSGGNTFSGNQTVTTGNVGIGSTFPQRLLQVGDIDVVGSEAMIRLVSRGGSAGRIWDFGIPQTGDFGGGYNFIVHDTGLAYPAQFLVQVGTGNVGIGTTNPLARLDVDGSVRATQFIGDGSGLTNVPGTLQQQVVGAANVQAQPNRAYEANSGTQSLFTLATNANVGDVVQISGLSGGWQVQSAQGQSINGYPAPSLSWITRLYTADWHAVACSADGTKLVAAAYLGFLYLSTNSGVTWSPSSSPFSGWHSLASSTNAVRLLAGTLGNQLYTSGDSGATWTPHGPTANWTVASAADGMRLVAAANPGQIYTSLDGGLTWTPHGPNTNWHGIACSADGSKLIAAAFGGGLYTSTDGGTNWVPRGASLYYERVASSSDGTRLFAATSQLSFSTNGGTNWTAAQAPLQSWSAIACSADGTRVIAGTETGQLYLSTDGGISFSANGLATNWTTGVSCSADGSKMTAVAGNPSGLIYTSSNFPGMTLAGAQGTTITLQYAGGGVWQPVNASAADNTPGTIVSRDTNGNIGAANISASSLNAAGTVTATAFAGSGAGLTGVALLSGGNALTGNQTVTGGSFAGSGSGLSNLTASSLSSGTLADARLSSNVALRAGGNTFNGNQIVTNGNVAIGTASPAALNNLQINPTFHLGNGYGLSVNKADYGANIQINRTNGQSGIGLVVDNSSAGNASTSLLLLRNNAATSAQTLLNVQADGMVGIGTPSPAFPLSFPSTLGDKISFYGGAGNHHGIGIQSFQLQIHTDSSLADIVFGYGQSTNLTETMRIKGTGRVGIGTASPQKPLQVGDANVGGSEGMIHLASRAPASGAVRDWQIGVPQTGDVTTGIGYSFIIHDTGMTYPAQLMVQYGSGFVGIGTTNPSSRLTVATGASSYGLEHTDGARRLGTYFDTSGAWLRTITADKLNLSANANASIFPGVTIMETNLSQYVGIMNSNPKYALDINGDVYAINGYKPGGGAWAVASDARLKKNVHTLSGALDKLLALRGVNFEYIDPEKIRELPGERMGLIAQEVEKVFPDWVETGKDGFKRVTVRGLEALVVEALRQLRDEQEAKIASIKSAKDAEIEALTQRMEKLERMVEARAGGAQ